MLSEYALTPDIFSSSAHGSPELAEARLQILKPIVLEEAVVRNLRAGEWWTYIQAWTRTEDCHRKAKELLKQIGKTRRLRDVRHLRIGDIQPNTPEEWLLEALISHEDEVLTGIITLPELAQQSPYQNNEIIARIDRLTNQDWQDKRDHMIRISKQTSTYRKHLKLLFKCANSIMFIDPYLDPSQSHYREFDYLLDLIKNPETRIEIHLAAKGIGRDDNIDRNTLTLQNWKNRFKALVPTLKTNTLEVQIFIWEYFHDRYIITDLMGINLSSGLDVSPNSPVDWSRLPKRLLDQTQVDFNPNSSAYSLKFSFTLSEKQSL
jgi:hypothetical protein